MKKANERMRFMKIKMRSGIIIISLSLIMTFTAGCKPGGNSSSSGSVESSANSSTVSSAVSSMASSETTSTAKATPTVTPGKTSSSAASSGNVVSKTDNSFTQTAVFYEKITNLGGVTIKLASPWNEWKVTSGSPPMQVLAAEALTKISKDYNCKIEVVNVIPSTFQSDIITNFAAGKVYADIFETQGNIIPFAPYTMNVSKVASLELSRNGWNKFIGSSTIHKNVQYGVGFMMTQNLAISQAIMMFNKTLADQYKLPDMYSLVKNKQWTWDKFKELSKSIYDKTGRKTRGMVVQHDSQIEYLLHTNNISLLAKTGGGQYYFNYNDNKLISGIQFWSDYAKAGYILGVTGPEDYGASESKEFMARKSLFYLGDYICTSSQLNPYMEDVYGVLPLPKGPAASDYVSVNNTKYFCLTKDNKNIEAAGKVLVAIAKRTSWDMKQWDEIQLDSALRDEASLDMMHRITVMRQVDHEAATRGLTNNYMGAVLDAVLKQEKTPITAMTEIKGSENANINNTYN